MPPVLLTPEKLNELQELSKTILSHGLETGEIHPVLGEPIDADAAKALLEKFWQENQTELVGAGIDYLFSFVRAAAFPETPIEEFTEALGDISTEQLVEVAAADAVTVEVARDRLIQGRQKVLAEFKAIASVIVRGAIASAMAAALGMS